MCNPAKIVFHKAQLYFNRNVILLVQKYKLSYPWQTAKTANTVKENKTVDDNMISVFFEIPRREIEQDKFNEENDTNDLNLNIG